MMNAEQQRDWFQQIMIQAGPHLKNTQQVWLEKVRENAKQAVNHLPVITRKQEAWRYDRVEKLFEKRFKLLLDEIQFNQLDMNHWLLPDFESYRLVFVNGRCIRQFSDVSNLPDKSVVASLHSAINLMPQQVASWVSQTAQRHNDLLFASLNTALLNDGAMIHIDKFTELDKPIEIIYLNTGEPGSETSPMSQARNIISIGEGAKVTLIERFIGTDTGQYFHNNLCDIHIAEAASLTHYRSQNESRQAYHLSNLSISQYQKSHYYSNFMSFGGSWSKTDIKVDFNEQDADCEISGLYLVGDQQMTDFHLDVNHSKPACQSREKFKGILYGKGRAVFDGHILVNKQAQGSDAQLNNDNLLLTRDAEVDTKPQLEIYADDVKCSHGTTVGQLDPQQIFYMRSRGLSEKTAQRLLCLGFARDIIHNIEEGKFSDYVEKQLIHILNEQVLSKEEG